MGAVRHFRSKKQVAVAGFLLLLCLMLTCHVLDEFGWITCPCRRAVPVCPADVRELRRATFWSQSREDFALLQQYYLNPLKCNGTFVEIGALDGRTYSNTLFYEQYLGWSGVLIEAQPQNFIQLQANRPASHTFGMAVCTEGVERLQFTGDGAAGAVSGQMTNQHAQSWKLSSNSTYTVVCKPLKWIFKQAKVTSIDFFSLDVEGSEYQVLKTMDWSIPVGVFVVEMHANDPESKDHLVRKLLNNHGYTLADWNISTYCVKGQDCTDNEVYERSKR